MFQLWLDLLHRQRVAYFMCCVNETSFLRWREHGIAGVANICGC